MQRECQLRLLRKAKSGAITFAWDIERLMRDVAVREGTESSYTHAGTRGIRFDRSQASLPHDPNRHRIAELLP
jgi:hypothetical protein